MNALLRAASLLLALLLLACPALAAGEAAEEEPAAVLDLSADTAKLAVTVLSFIDGDTVHFSVPADVAEALYAKDAPHDMYLGEVVDILRG